MKYYSQASLKQYRKDVKSVQDPDLKKYLEVAIDIAKKYPRTESRIGVNTLMDIIGFANIGVVEAYNKIDPTKSEGERINYVKSYIESRMKRYIFKTMSDVKVSEYAIQKSKQEEIADMLLGNFMYSNKMFNWKLRIKFDDFAPNTNLRYSTIIKQEYTNNKYVSQECKNAIDDIMSVLSKREKDVLTLNFGIDIDKQSMKQIAKTMGISEIGVKKAKARALKKLNTEQNREFLKDFL